MQVEFELSRTSSAHDSGYSSVVSHNGIGVLDRTLVPVVAGLAISPGAWHKAGRLDASAHQAENSQHVFIHGCVGNCDVQLTSVYI